MTVLGADKGSNHDLVMTAFRGRLKKTKKETKSILRFAFEKLRNPDVADTFYTTIGGKFAPIINQSDDYIDIVSMIA